MTREVELLLGPPGTGKTTSLLNIVEQLIANGTDPARIGFVAFTRKAAEEAATRACTQLRLDRKQLPNFRTLHSLAYGHLGLSGSEIMSTDDYSALAQGTGWCTFKHQYNAFTERCEQGGAIGDRCLRIYSLSKSMRISLESAWRLSGDKDISLWKLEQFARVYESYKKDFHKCDFSDILDLDRAPYNLEVLIVDEAQDLTRQQWAMVEHIWGNVKRVIVAGDDDQAIYQWSGADIDYFLKLRGMKTVLPHSYRLPVTHKAKCDELAAKIAQRYPKVWTARDEQGVLKYVPGFETVDLTTGGSWLLLGRHQHLLEQLAQLAERQGVVYRWGGQWSNQRSYVQAVVTYEGLRKGHVLDARRVKALTRFIHNFPEVEGGRKYAWGDIAWPFTGAPPWMDALNLLTVQEREYVRALLRRGESLSEPGRIIISTIHGVKGGEADNVLLLTDITYKVQQKISTAQDEERRVWYVACSRARHGLFINSPMSKFSVTL